MQPDAISDVNLDRIKLDIVAKLALALNDGGKEQFSWLKNCAISQPDAISNAKMGRMQLQTLLNEGENNEQFTWPTRLCNFATWCNFNL